VTVGRVARVDHLPAQDLLAIATAGGEVLVPFVKAIVPEVDIAAGTVTLTPPAGLFEELPDDEPEADAEPQGDAEPEADSEGEPAAPASDD
jgi:16S rRNA processing protein RimM